MYIIKISLHQRIYKIYKFFQSNCIQIFTENTKKKKESNFIWQKIKWNFGKKKEKIIIIIIHFDKYFLFIVNNNK